MLKTEQDKLLNEFLQFHGKEWFLRQLKALYPDIYKCVNADNNSQDVIVLDLEKIRQYYTRYQLEDIVEKLSYCVAKILHDKVLLRPINNSETLTTDLFVHMSAKRDLATKGLKAKSANIDSF